MTKEEKEFIEAVTRDSSMAMTPVEELTLLGFYESNIAAVMGRNNEIYEVELGGEFTALNEIWERVHHEIDHPVKDWDKIEEYEFDENNEKYKELAEVLRMNNDRRKYFA